MFFFCFLFLKLNKTTNILCFYFCFAYSGNSGAMADSRYTGFPEITDHDVLDLQ